MDHMQELKAETKKQRILLVWPKVPSNTFWSFSHVLKFVGKKSSMPPLGLLTIASYLPSHWDVVLVDMNTEELTNAQLEWADTVFVSAMIVQRQSFDEVVRRCNAMSRKIVAGGPLVTSLHETFPGVDARVIGEAEQIMDELVADLDSGQLKAIYQRDNYPDIGTVLVPRFDLLNLKSYASMAVQYSRGCPFRCEFCDIWTAYGNKPRLKNADRLLAEFDELYRLGWVDPVFIVDDNFIGNRGRVKAELLPAIQQWQEEHEYPFQLFTEASINLADDAELLNGMREAGFDEVFIGIETPSVASLTETGKNQNLKTNLYRAIKTIQQNGLEVMGGFIVGFDSDTDSIFQEQLDFIQQAGIPKAMVGLLTALPNTKLYHRLESEKRIVGTSTGNNTNEITLNFRPKMELSKLLAGYRGLLERIYDHRMRNYFMRCNLMLDAFEKRVTCFHGVKWRDIKTVMRSVFVQPFMAYRGQYFWFLIRNFFRNRDLFPTALRLAIQGHHFFMITRQTVKAAKVSLAMDEQYQYLKIRLNRISSEVLFDSQKRLRKLARLRYRAAATLTKFQRKINRINVDFGADVRNHYQIFSANVEQLFKPFGSDRFNLDVTF